MIISVEHHGRQSSVLEEEAGLVHVEDPSNDHSLITSYHNQMEFCIKERVFWRPKRRIRPVVDGPQIAKIVGPEGEEIYTDEYGRVKVQFPWDRYGKSNEHSSCWIRVSQNWAGMGWGHIAIPRIDQEVIVEFLEGDPDQPIVTGRTYHDVNRVPYNLADHKTRMTIKSKTHKGDGFNELRFEDEKDQEEIFIHAEKDMNSYVQNHKRTVIKNSYIEQVSKDRLTMIGGNMLQTNALNYEHEVAKAYTLNVGEANVPVEHVMDIDSQKVKLVKPFSKLKSTSMRHVAANLGNVGELLSDLRDLNPDIELDNDFNDLDIGNILHNKPGNYTINVTDTMSTNVGFWSYESIGGYKTINANKGINIASTNEINLTSGKTFVVDSDGSITLSCGKAQLVMKKDGTIHLSAIKIFLDGNEIKSFGSSKIDLESGANIKLKAPKIDLN